MRIFRINDIFYSLQGEGHNTGRAAVFIRFAGCNLRCSFCDTEFNAYREISDEEIVDAVKSFSPQTSDVKPLVVLTGGEPTLQVDEAFVDLLHQLGYEVAMESNGTRQAPKNLDWLTVSPKQNPVHQHCQELKVVFNSNGEVTDFGIDADYYYLQPCDTGDAARNAQIMSDCIQYIENHPKWRLSLQTHKLIGIK